MFTHVNSPFKWSVDINNELQNDLQCVLSDKHPIDDTEIQKRLAILYKWICSSPNITTYRVNTLKVTNKEVVNHLEKSFIKCQNHAPSISTYPNFPELVVIDNWNDSVQLDLAVRDAEVIVDAACGLAVLRGAHVFAPGVIGLPHGLNIDDKVSIFADIAGHCKKGLQKKYEDTNKIFIGNGILKQTREQLFCNNQNTSGIAVCVTSVVSRVPQLNNESVPMGWAFLQNLPSIICSKILDPQPGETVLDMCAAPGNKTTHISTLMNGKGVLIVLEKCKSKLQRIEMNCKYFSSGNVKIFCYDSTKAVCTQSRCIEEGPPFAENSFDRILLDGPCSGLGQRPQLCNSITVPQLRSYVPLQRKLFTAAVRLLKPGGILVYSTCTITVAENEGIISWALKTYPCLKLKSVKDKSESLGLEVHFSPGYNVDGLSEEDSTKLCRFGPGSNSVGFFIGCFVKENDNKNEDS